MHLLSVCLRRLEGNLYLERTTEVSNTECSAMVSADCRRSLLVRDSVRVSSELAERLAGMADIIIHLVSSVARECGNNQASLPADQDLITLHSALSKVDLTLYVSCSPISSFSAP